MSPYAARHYTRHTRIPSHLTHSRSHHTKAQAHVTRCDMHTSCPTRTSSDSAGPRRLRAAHRSPDSLPTPRLHGVCDTLIPLLLHGCRCLLFATLVIFSLHTYTHVCSIFFLAHTHAHTHTRSEVYMERLDSLYHVIVWSTSLVASLHELTPYIVRFTKPERLLFYFIIRVVPFSRVDLTFAYVSAHCTRVHSTRLFHPAFIDRRRLPSFCLC